MERIDVRKFDGMDLPEWMTEDQANLICCWLNTMHDGGHVGERFHVLHRYEGGLFLHFIRRIR